VPGAGCFWSTVQIWFGAWVPFSASTAKGCGGSVVLLQCWSLLLIVASASAVWVVALFRQVVRKCALFWVLNVLQCNVVKLNINAGIRTMKSAAPAFNKRAQRKRLRRSAGPGVKCPTGREMGSTIAFYCGENDTRSLEEYALSIGLALVSTTIDAKVSASIDEGPYCYLSVLPISDLNPYGEKKNKLSDATDPLIGFMRSYFMNPYLVLGHLYLSNDVPDLHKITKPYYSKLSKWVKRNWSKYGDIYIGPDATKLIDSGAQKVNALPGTFTYEKISI
jgi:hypothetical protein